MQQLYSLTSFRVINESVEILEQAESNNLSDNIIHGTMDPYEIHICNVGSDGEHLKLSTLENILDAHITEFGYRDGVRVYSEDTLLGHFENRLRQEI